MAQRPKVHYQATEDLLLFRLQFALAKNERLNNSLKSLSTRLNITLQLVKICANRLEGDGYCKVETVEEFGEHPVTGSEASYNEDYLELTEAGIAEVESWPAEKYRQTAQRSDLTIEDYEFESDEAPLRDPLGASLDQDAAPLGGDHIQASEHNDEPELAPASDRLVTLDHNSSEYKEATSALDKAIEEFRKDHRLDNELGPEKPALLQTLEAGRRLLDDTKIKADIAITLLVEPLKLVAKRYESELVGALAAGAVTVILALLGFI